MKIDGAVEFIGRLKSLGQALEFGVIPGWVEIKYGYSPAYQEKARNNVRKDVWTVAYGTYEVMDPDLTTACDLLARALEVDFLTLREKAEQRALHLRRTEKNLGLTTEPRQ